MAKTRFSEVRDRTFMEAIMIRGNCLPAQVSRPEDLVRLRLLRINYTTPVDGVKLTGASLDDYSFELDGDTLYIKDDRGVKRMVIREVDDAPVLDVFPLYGFSITEPSENGEYDLTIYYPDGSRSINKRSTGGKPRSEWLSEAEGFVSSIYEYYEYTKNWRDGALLPS